MPTASIASTLLLLLPCALGSACDGSTPASPVAPPQAADPTPAADVGGAEPAPGDEGSVDPTLGDVSAAAQRPPRAVLAVGATIEIGVACYGQLEPPGADIGSPDAQERIRLAIRDAWTGTAAPHPRFVVAPTRSKVEVTQLSGASVRVAPLAGPWVGKGVYLPTSCVAKGRPASPPPLGSARAPDPETQAPPKPAR